MLVRRSKNHFDPLSSFNFSSSTDQKQKLCQQAHNKPKNQPSFSRENRGVTGKIANYINYNHITLLTCVSDQIPVVFMSQNLIFSPKMPPHSIISSSNLTKKKNVTIKAKNHFTKTKMKTSQTHQQKISLKQRKKKKEN